VEEFKSMNTGELISKSTLLPWRAGVMPKCHTYKESFLAFGEDDSDSGRVVMVEFGALSLTPALVPER
jgi:hypothetical protein